MQVYVSLVPIMHFIGKHGLDGVMRMVDSLNSGLPHKQIASQFSMSTSQFSEFHRHVFKIPVYELKDEIREYLDIIETERQRRWAESRGKSTEPCPVVSITSKGR